MNDVETVVVMEWLLLACRGCVMYFLCVKAGRLKQSLNGGCVPRESHVEVRRRLKTGHLSATGLGHQAHRIFNGTLKCCVKTKLLPSMGNR